MDNFSTLLSLVCLRWVSESLGLPFQYTPDRSCEESNSKVASVVGKDG